METRLRRVLRTGFMIGQIDACVANGGKPI
jgi:hypothetical protein